VKYFIAFHVPNTILLHQLQVAESRMIYAEDKEAEVKLLERSVEELECTVNVLENKVVLN
jgi:kinesin family protein 15